MVDLDEITPIPTDFSRAGPPHALEMPSFFVSSSLGEGCSPEGFSVYDTAVFQPLECTNPRATTTAVYHGIHVVQPYGET